MSQESLKTALGKTIEAITANPAGANLIFRASTEWKGDVTCTAKVRDFPPLVIDEPSELGGQNAGMNPVELVLVAFGTCQEIMYAAYAAVMGIPLTKVKVELKGFLDLRGLFGMVHTVPPGYKNIRYETYIDSPADPEQIRKLVHMVEGHCPVMDTLTRPIEISGRTYLNGAEVDYCTCAMPKQAAG